jgi:translation elongation factor EF-G
MSGTGLGAKKIEIINYYDRLISDMDTYVEESIKKMSPNEPMINQTNLVKHEFIEPEFEELNEYDDISQGVFNKNQNKPFEYNFETKCDIEKLEPIKYKNKIDYFNAVRERSIEEIKRIQKANVEKLNTKVVISNKPNDESCCLVNVDSFFLSESIEFRMITLIFDFDLMLNEQDVQNLGYFNVFLSYIYF